ncbi:MAG: hypothetical protein H0T76_24255 [Nannocystis sp.]|nr:hypothetical protein [Nannocystis sp.]MBA3549602.1 hypothetical protein [Nannocystis sp.]
MTESPSAAVTSSLPLPTVAQRWLLAYLVLYIAPFPLNFAGGAFTLDAGDDGEDIYVARLRP